MFNKCEFKTEEFNAQPREGGVLKDIIFIACSFDDQKVNEIIKKLITGVSGLETI